MSLLKPFRHALPVNDFLFNDSLYLTHAGWESIKPGEKYPQMDAPMFYFEWEDGRILPEFCLAFVLKGCGEIETTKHHDGIKAGQAFFFRPGEWHRHRPSLKNGWDIMWIHFNGDAPLLWLREVAFRVTRNQPVIENTPLFQSQFTYLLECVHRSPSTNSANYSRQVIGLLSHFMSDTSEVEIHDTRGLRDKDVEKAVEYIWNYSHDNLDVAAVAHNAGMTRRTLDRRFKAATGRSVLEEIHMCRVSRAAKLLAETDIPAKHIIHRAGFSSEEQLRLAFQKSFGISPQAYRKTHGAHRSGKPE